jgi:A/G-specific adenine glycosylase
VNAHLWEFPNLELSPDDSDLRAAAHRALGVLPRTLEPLGTIKHSITRYRITLEAYRVTGRPAARIPVETRGRWLGRARLKQLAFASAHKQILRLSEETKEPLPAFRKGLGGTDRKSKTCR